MASTQTTNLIKKYDDIIFIQDDVTGSVEVARAAWFKTMGESETYSNYGIQNTFEHCDDASICPVTEDEDGDEVRENCQCEEFEVRAYNFWNGSNFQTIVIESDTYDTRYSEITDEDEIAKYTEMLESAEFHHELTGVKEYLSEIDEELVISASIWQGEWSLFTISERDKNKNTNAAPATGSIKTGAYTSD